MGIRKQIQFSISFALILIMLYYDASGMTFCFLAASAMHELAHLSAIIMCGSHVTAFDISPLGGSMNYSPLSSYKSDIIIALAGPLGSFAFACIASGLGMYTLGGSSLILGIFNLLPILPLDGSGILLAVLAPGQGISGSIRILNIISIVFCVILIFLGLYIFVISRYNITMLFIAVWLSFYNLRLKGNNNVQKNT